MNKKLFIAGLAATMLLTGCGTKPQTEPKEQYQALMESLNDLYEQYGSGTITEEQADSIMENVLAESVALAKANPGHEVCYSILGDMYYYMSTEQKAEVFAGLCPDSLEAHKLGKLYHAFQAEQKTAVGMLFTDIEGTTPDGKILRLSDMVGKTDYVLVDFWATWCGPCRASLPTLKEAYTKAPAGKLAVLGVSLDTDGERWKTFIGENGLTWQHISDLKGWESEPAAMYGVCSIPATVLIDREGKIVARNVEDFDF